MQSSPFWLSSSIVELTFANKDKGSFFSLEVDDASFSSFSSALRLLRITRPLGG